MNVDVSQFLLMITLFSDRKLLLKLCFFSKFIKRNELLVSFKVVKVIFLL